jgi:hypothetical protein
MSCIQKVKARCATDCHPYVSRTNWVPTPFPTHYTSERQMAAQYPWWGGQWRTPESPPLPQVFYPGPIWPRAVCAPDTCDAQEPSPAPYSLLNPNWALTR